MTRLARLLVAVAAVSLGPALAGEGGKEKAPQPTPLTRVLRPISDMLFDLQSLQARMATGDRSAYAKQVERNHAIGEAILNAPADNWKTKAEVEAAAAYLLGGGQPKIIQKLLESNVVPTEQEAILRGALAYVIGCSLDAETLLSEIDPRGVSLRLGGQLAYVQAVLMTTRAPERAIERLDLARLLAPGSLVEEAAMRREILMFCDRHDADRVLFLAHQYATRFPNSIYADNFVQGLATTSVKDGLVDDLPSLRRFEEMLSITPQPRRIEFLVTTARAQTIAGQFQVAGAAAEDALSLMAPGAPEEPAARLYASAARALGHDYEAGLAALKAVDRGKLSPSDQSLHAATLYIAGRLHDPLSDSDYAQADHEDKVAEARSPNPVSLDAQDPIGATIRLGDATLAKADEILGKPRGTP